MTAPTFWTDAEPLESVARLSEAPDTVTFSFQAPSGALFNHRPGQFVTLELPIPGGPLHRTYTISSSPSRSTSMTVTVKAQPGSVGTRWMLDHLRPGTRLKVSGPRSSFSHLDHPARKYLFISAGSGITPMVSMTTYMYDSGRDPDIVFINCARKPSEIIFRQRLEMMASRITGLQLAWVVEETDPYQLWTGYRGRMNQLLLGLTAPDYLDREVFCCGPEPFMTAVREALAGLGFDMAHYHQESFHAPVGQTAVVPEGVTPDDDAAAQVTFGLSDRTVDCAETDTLLSVAQSAGLMIPTGCTMGVCGTCRIRKTSGEVHMVHNGGITEDEIAQGYVLACCSHPLGKVSVEA